jgi:LPS-assembly lipoprotein
MFSLSACGFHLRGHNVNEKSFPFASLYLKSAAPTPFIADLENHLELYKIRIAATAAEADLTLDIVSEASDKQILALSGAGQVLEYQLRYRVSLRAYDKQMMEWLPADEISLQRTLTYDPAQILAKEQEESLLYRDMRSDAVQQVMRRLSRAKPRPDPANIPAAVSQPNPASSALPATLPAPAK